MSAPTTRSIGSYAKRTTKQLLEARVDVSRFYGLHDKLQAILDQHLPYSAKRNKLVSGKTKSNRANVLHRAFRELADIGFKLQDPYNLKERHVDALVKKWESEGKSAATIQVDFSHLNWLADVMCKFGLFSSLENYLVDPSRAKRSYVAASDKSWSGNDVSVDDQLAKLERADPVTAMQIRLMAAFGLRVKEAIMFKPLENVQGDLIALKSRGNGTKGGRARDIPIETPEQKALLAHAQSFARSADGSVAHPNLDLKQELRRFYYVLERCGITRKSLAVTAYGLRHQYMHSMLENQSGGVEVPVKLQSDIAALNAILDSGDEGQHAQAVALIEKARKARYVRVVLDTPDDLERLEKARLVTMSALGHSRLRISTAYAGSHRQMVAHARRLGRILQSDYRRLTVRELANLK